MGLGLTTESIAKFGQMILEKGMFNGKRIVSEGYVKEMTTPQIYCGDDDKKHGQSYGYQMRVDKNGDFFHPGGFGTLCYVSPHNKMVIAVTSRMNNYKEVISLIKEKLIFNDNPIKPEPKAYELLTKKIKALSYPEPEIKPVPVGVKSLSNAYKLSENPHGLQKAVFEEKSSEAFNLRLIYANREDSTLIFNFTKPTNGYDVFVKDIQFHMQKYISYAVWDNASQLRLTVIYLETPYVVTYLIIFLNDCIQLSFDMNVSLNLKNFTAAGRVIN